ncbi:MAG: hypothetical protein VST69_09415 [Nitrospirota bacterium]|nr:hypothetical protein [Nitrospirota bacterium]
MNTKDQFKLSVNATDMQKAQYEEQKRTIRERKRNEDIGKIQDSKVQRQARTMLNHRDEAVKQERERLKEKLKEKIKETIDKNVQPKPQYNLKPPRGMVPPTPIQRSSHIERQMKDKLGIKIEQDAQRVGDGWNKKIDELVKKTLEKEQVKSRTQPEAKPTGKETLQKPTLAEARQAMREKLDRQEKAEPTLTRSPSRNKGLDI